MYMIMIHRVCIYVVYYTVLFRHGGVASLANNQAYDREGRMVCVRVGASHVRLAGLDKCRLPMTTRFCSPDFLVSLSSCFGLSNPAAPRALEFCVLTPFALTAAQYIVYKNCKFFLWRKLNAPPPPPPWDNLINVTGRGVCCHM